MTHHATVPVTFRPQRAFDHRPSLLFESFADIEQRIQWWPSADEVILFESHDFRVGGTDHFMRTSRPDMSVAGTLHYEHIVDNERIVFTERLIGSDDELLAISLVTWTIAPTASGALLSIADQTTSITGSGPIEGGRCGYEVMLDRLDLHLSKHDS